MRKVVKHFTREKEKTRAWRKILEQTTGTLLRQSASEDDDGADAGAAEEGLELAPARASAERALELSQQAVRRELVLDRRAHVPRVAERAAGADEHAWRPRRAASSAPSIAGAASQSDVRLGGR